MNLTPTCTNDTPSTTAIQKGDNIDVSFSSCSGGSVTSLSGGIEPRGASGAYKVKTDASSASQQIVVTGASGTTTYNFNVTDAPSQLSITTQPVGGASGATLSTQPVVAIQTSSGGSTTSTATVSVSIASGAGGSLGGTTSKAAVNGTATFTNLTLSGVIGTNYVLQFTASGLTSASSSNVTVTLGAATKLGIQTQPSGGNSGVALATQPVILVQDSGGNTVTTSSATVTATSSGGSDTLANASATASSGIATFSGLAITGSGSRTLTFSSSGLTSVTSNSITITTTATKLGMQTQPAGAFGSDAFTQQPVVLIQDAGGTTDTSSTASVTAALLTGTGTLGGTTTVSAVNGVATFTNLSASTIGAKTLRFTSGGLTSVDSTSFTVASGASQLTVQTEPAGAFDGAPLTQQPVIAVKNSSGTTVTSSSASVTASIASGSGTLSGTTTVSASSGVATFTNLTISGSGAHTLQFTSSGLTSVTSSSFTVSGTGGGGGGQSEGGGSSSSATPTPSASALATPSASPTQPAKPDRVKAPETKTPPAWAWGRLKQKDIQVDSGPTTGEIVIKAKGGRPLELLGVQAPPGVTVKVVSKGADFEKPSTWQKMGYGDVCWKMIDFKDATEYALPSATPPFGAPPVGWKFALAVVNTKAGQTKFADPSPGMIVSGGGVPIRSVLLCSSAIEEDATAPAARSAAVQGPVASPALETRARPMAPVSGRKVTLCHRTSSETNPYVEITVDKESVVKEGHDIHNGPVFPAANWGDIIPPFDGYPGKNWTADGQKILADGCRPPSTKVSLCHRTSSDTNPYVFITVDQSAVLKEGHGSHTGPVFPEDDWGDIIPPFPGYAGLNWNSAGQAIYDLGCDPPAKLKLKRAKSNGKVTLCHRTSSVTNPYVEITVDQSAVLKEGHGSHTGPLFPEDDWGDIIPPFEGYAGMNWPSGKSIFDAGCQAPKKLILDKVKKPTGGKVTLCHATSSESNPYVEITVDESAILNEGHGSHTGGVFPADGWGDIIPPFGDYPGLNWDSAGQQIVKDGCKAPKKQATPETPVRQKVTLCHATSSKTNPYVVITVDDDAVLRQGHDTHTGPLFPQQGWGDIIPAFGDYPGLNWNAAGKAILDDNCQVPKAPPLDPREGPRPVPPETPDPEEPEIIIEIDPTPSPSPTPTSSNPGAQSQSPSPSPSGTRPSSGSPSPTPTSSASPTPTGSRSPSPTASSTATSSPTPSASGSPSGSSSSSASPSPSGSATGGSPAPSGSSSSPSPSGSAAAASGSPSPSGSGTPTPTGSGTPTPGASGAATPTPSGSSSPTPGSSESPTPGSSASPSGSTPTGGGSPSPSTPGGPGTEPSTGPSTPGGGPSAGPTDGPPLDTRELITFTVTDGASEVTIVRTLASVEKKAGVSGGSAAKGTSTGSKQGGGTPAAAGSSGESPALVDTGLNTSALITGAAVLILLGLMLLPPAIRRRS